MTDASHVLDNLGERCPECGTRHRVVERLPETPLRAETVDGLADRDRFAFSRAITYWDGEPYGLPDAEVTENVVLSTDDVTWLLGFFQGTGWVVERSFEHDPDVDPAVYGENVWVELSKRVGEAMDAQFPDEATE